MRLSIAPAALTLFKLPRFMPSLYLFECVAEALERND